MTTAIATTRELNIDDEIIYENYNRQKIKLSEEILDSTSLIEYIYSEIGDLENKIVMIKQIYHTCNSEELFRMMIGAFNCVIKEKLIKNQFSEIDTNKTKDGIYLQVADICTLSIKRSVFAIEFISCYIRYKYGNISDEKRNGILQIYKNIAKKQWRDIGINV